MEIGVSEQETNGLKIGDKVWLAKSCRVKSSPYAPKRGGKYACQGTITRFQTGPFQVVRWATIKWDNGNTNSHALANIEPVNKLTDWPGD